MESALRYASGQEVRLGDIVRLGGDSEGVVVCSMDTDEYTPEYPKAQWEYLKRGAVVFFEKFGAIHYEQAEPDLELVKRSAAT
jgi:hypothetical protein